MHVIMARTAVLMLFILALGALSYAGEPPRPPASSAPSIEGTYQLISRQLADGTRLSPPASMGLNTYTKRHRTFHRVLKDATGTFFSSSNVSTYTLTATEYRETRLFSVLDDQIGGKDTVYHLSSETRSALVTVEGGRIQFKDPFRAYPNNLVALLACIHHHDRNAGGHARQTLGRRPGFACPLRGGPSLNRGSQRL